MKYHLPIASSGGLSVIYQIKKFPMLDAEENTCSLKLEDNGNLKSAHKLVTSLRLVAKIAMGYRGYGLPVNELISEVILV